MQRYFAKSRRFYKNDVVHAIGLYMDDILGTSNNCDKNTVNSEITKTETNFILLTDANLINKLNKLVFNVRDSNIRSCLYSWGLIYCQSYRGKITELRLASEESIFFLIQGELLDSDWLTRFILPIRTKTCAVRTKTCAIGLFKK